MRVSEAWRLEAVWDKEVRDGGYGRSGRRKERLWREEVLDLADLLVNFGKAVLDFLGAIVKNLEKKACCSPHKFGLIK